MEAILVSTSPRVFFTCNSYASTSNLLQSGVSAVIALPILRETFLPVILKQPTADKGSDSHTRFEKKMSMAILQTAKCMRHTVVLVAAIHVSVGYVYIYFLLTTFPTVFNDQYGLDAGQIGLTFFSPAIGSCLALLIASPFSDWYCTQQRFSKGESRPEDRLVGLLPGNILVPLGMLWYGWSVQTHLHWIMPLVGAGLASIGITFIFISINAYLTDSFGIYAPNAIGVNLIVRSLFGALIPLAGPSLYGRLGYGWGNSLLSLLVVAFCPLALVLFKCGTQLRNDSKPHSPKGTSTQNLSLSQDRCEDRRK